MHAPVPGSHAHEVFVARQPILDRARRAFAYELLFRASATAETSDPLPDDASANVITDAVLAFGLDTLTYGRPAFIKVSRHVLVSGLPRELPPNRIVLEISDGIEPDAEVLEACRTLRCAGYRIALTDFALDGRWAPLLPYVDFLKCGPRALADPEARRRFVARHATSHLALVAERVETADDFEEAKRDGFSYVQGFFFGKPATQVAKDIVGHRLAYLRLLRALQDPDLSLAQLEELVKPDPSLCYRILRTVNSAGFGQMTTIASLRHALVLLGYGTVRRWVALWLLAGVSSEAPDELLVMSSVRARCCETLAHRSCEGASVDGFLLGMCSLLDAILECPMSAVLAQLPLPEETAAALAGEDSAGRRMLDCVIAYERGDWDRCRQIASQADIDLADLRAAYADALRWADEFRPAAA